MNAPQWLLLADDLTGALDTGVMLAQRGARVVTFTQGESPRLPQRETDALVVHLNSRHLSPDAAAALVRRWVEFGIKMGIQCFYKKTDSALRGNVGAELSALGDALGQCVWFAPAFPSAGRTTCGGRQYDHGLPLERSAFADDPHHPMRTSFIPDILGAQCADAVHCIPSGGDLPAEDGIWVFDAQDELALARIGETLSLRERPIAAAGCAGFAAHIPLRVSFTAPLPAITSPVWAVSGSVHAATLRQIAYAKERGIPVFAPTPEQLLLGDIQRILHDAHAQFAAGQSVLIASAVDTNDRAACMKCAKNLDMPPKELHARITDTMAELLLSAPDGAARLAVGGDLLSAALTKGGISEVYPLCQLSPGVALSRIGCGLWLSKSGGFGGEDTLYSICEGEILCSH